MDKCRENPEGSGLGCVAHPFRRMAMTRWGVVGSFVSLHCGGGVLEWAESFEMATLRAEVLSECKYMNDLFPCDMNKE